MTTYYCIANPVPLVKLTYSPGIIGAFDNLRQPIFSKLNVTTLKLQQAFDQSEKLIFCKRLDEAKALRRARIVLSPANVSLDFIKGAIAQGYPLADYGIYEVEVEEDIEANFGKLNQKDDSELEGLVPSTLRFTATYAENGRSELPDIEVCVAKKSDLTCNLRASHYFSLETDEDEINTTSQFCTIA